MANSQGFYGDVVYRNSTTKLPKSTAIVTDFDPWTNNDIQCPDGSYNTVDAGIQLEVRKNYQLHFRGPYYDYPGAFYSPDSTCPQNFTGNHLIKMI